MGGKGNDGVASLVSLVPDAIGYLEYTRALQRLDRISFGVVQNNAGNFVVPDAASFQAATSSADWGAEKDFHLVLTNAPGEDAYPIMATTFVLMPKAPERSAAAINLVRWSLEAKVRRSFWKSCLESWSSRRVDCCPLAAAGLRAGPWKAA